MKRILCGVLAAALLLGLAGCSGAPASSKADSAPAASTTARTVEVDPALVAPSAIQPADAFAGGTGTESDPYQIATAEQLAYLADIANNWEPSVKRDELLRAYYVLTADIALNDPADFDQWAQQAPEYGWTPIETFSGHFDGQGHTVSGLYLYDISEKTCDIGLFDSLYNADVCGLTLDHCRIVVSGNASKAGTLAGTCLYSVLENCAVSDSQIVCKDSLYCDVSLGGIAGSLLAGSLVKRENAPARHDTAIRRCSFSGSIEAFSDCYAVGGIVADLSSGVLENCTSSGVFSVEWTRLGGIAGTVDGATGSGAFVSGCTSQCTLTSQNKNAVVGGIVGTASNSSAVASDTQIRNCVNKGIIQSAGSQTGGLVGDVYSGTLDSRLVIRDCRNEADVTGQNNTGGLVGQLTPRKLDFTLQDCANTGEVVGSTWVGGIVGMADIPGGDHCEVLRCSNSGAVNADSSAGGIVGGGVGPCTTPVGTELQLNACRNSGIVTVQRNMAGGILGAVISDKNGETIHIDKCENTGNVRSATTSGRLGGIVGGGVAGYVSNDPAAPACLVTNTVNCGDIVFGDGVQDFAGFDSLVTGNVTNETTLGDKVTQVLGGPCAGGIVAVSYRSAMENCLNTGSILLDSSMTPAFCTSDITAEGTQTVFAGAIYGLTVYSDDARNDTPQRERVVDCSYTGDAPIAVNAIFSADPSEFVSNVQQVTPQQAQQLAASLLS